MKLRDQDCSIYLRKAAAALLVGVSALSFTVPALAQETTSAPTQADVDSASATDQTIVVTGTRIQGVAPVGADVVQLSREDIQATGLTSTADVLNTVPSVLQIGGGNAYAGGQAQQGSTLSSFNFNKSPNIHGFGFGATLSLVNGHRVPYEGGNMNAFDGDNFPPQFLQRIDVEEDGGSALYGADAIAGTVNYIFRKPEDTAEVYGGFGTNEGDQDSYYVTGVVGRQWAKGTDMEGGIIATYQHSYQQQLMASGRSDLYNDDLSPYGGAASPLFSSPGNILVNGTYYSIPVGQNGEDLTLSDLGTTPNRQNTWTGIGVIPQVKADRFAANFEQHLSNWLRVFADGYYVKRHIFLNGPSSTTAGRVTNFGMLPFVPNANPYSPCNPSHYAGGVVTGPANLVAACQAGALQVAYSATYDIGTPERTGVTEGWSYGGGAEITLPYEWTVTATAYAGTEDENALATQLGGGPAVDPLTFNFFCDASQFQCTDPATGTALANGILALQNHTRYDMQDYALNANGKLFSLPAGDAKAAIGAEYYKASLLNQNNLGTNELDPRDVKSVYGEVFVPLVSSDMNVPAIDRLELSAAIRYDDYSDAGGTTNPRFGVNWWPVQGLKLYASYGTSFHAPGLADNDPYSQTSALVTSVAGSQISGTICSICQSPAYNGAAIYQTIGGAEHNLKPETSTNYSFGAEWKPSSIPRLSLSAKYWHTVYNNQINAPAYNVGTITAINQGIYNSQIIYNPSVFPTLAANNPTAFFGNSATLNASNPYCAASIGQSAASQAVYDAMIQCLNTGGEHGGLFGPPNAPGNVLAVVNGRRVNSGKTVADGIDFTADYSFGGDSSTWDVGAIASYILHWKVAPIQGAPLIEEVNIFGYPQQFRARGYLQWSGDIGPGRVSAGAFVNYANSYKMTPGQLPVGVDPSYAKIGSYTTVDLSLGFETADNGSWLTGGIGIQLSVQNVFSADPPLVVNQSGLAGSGLRFDPTFASPLGRVFQVQVSKKF